MGIGESYADRSGSRIGGGRRTSKRTWVRRMAGGKTGTLKSVFLNAIKITLQPRNQKPPCNPTDTLHVTGCISCP